MAGIGSCVAGHSRHLTVLVGVVAMLVSLLVVADRAAVAVVPPAAAGAFTYVRDPAAPQAVTVSWTEGPSSGTAVREGSRTRNPDVVVDTETGEIYPKTPGGGHGDSIGNISD